MGIYLRKSFRLGPLRLNLSKRGIGASVGVTGAGVGIDAAGHEYMHAGRRGLYHRARGRQVASSGGVAPARRARRVRRVRADHGRLMARADDVRRSASSNEQLKGRQVTHAMPNPFFPLSMRLDVHDAFDALGAFLTAIDAASEQILAQQQERADAEPYDPEDGPGIESYRAMLLEETLPRTLRYSTVLSSPTRPTCPFLSDSPVDAAGPACEILRQYSSARSPRTRRYVNQREHAANVSYHLTKAGYTFKVLDQRSTVGIRALTLSAPRCGAVYISRQTGASVTQVAAAITPCAQTQPSKTASPQ